MTTLPTSLDVADRVARLFVSLSHKAIQDHGKFTVALAGGTTPLLAYDLLATKYNHDVDWDKVFIFWSDERFVPPDHADSGILPVQRSLLSKINIPPENIFSFPTTGCELEEAAQKYSETIQKHFETSSPCFDLILLGLGLDGHTASLFPHSSTYNSSNLIDIETNSPKPPPIRLTFTHKLINQAHNVILIVTGKEKSTILKRVLSEPVDPQSIPAQGINPTHGTFEIIADEAAAGK